MTAHAPLAAVPPIDDAAVPSVCYLEVISLIENAHKLLLDVIKNWLEGSGMRGISPVQALLLFNIGSMEVSPGTLTSRGYYQGSNVSYNVKKLIELGYIESRRSDFDARSVRLRLTERGMDVHFTIAALLESHSREFGSDDWLDQEGVQAMVSGLRTLRRYWAQAAC